MKQNIFANAIKTTSRFEKFLLFFIGEERYIDREEVPNKVIVYKKMRGRIYIIDIYSLPPEHINCRCAIICAPNQRLHKDPPSDCDERAQNINPAGL